MARDFNGWASGEPTTYVAQVLTQPRSGWSVARLKKNASELKTPTHMNTNTLALKVVKIGAGRFGSVGWELAPTENSSGRMLRQHRWVAVCELAFVSRSMTLGRVAEGVLVCGTTLTRRNAAAVCSGKDLDTRGRGRKKSCEPDSSTLQ